MLSVKYINDEDEEFETIQESENDIIIDGKVTYKTIENVLSKLEYAEEAFASDSKKDTINVFIIECTECDYKSAISIYGLLKSSNLKINTFIFEKAIGMSLLIFLAGDNRFMHDWSSYIRIRDPHILKCYEKYETHCRKTGEEDDKLLFDVSILENIIKYTTFLNSKAIHDCVFSDKITWKSALNYRMATGTFKQNR